MPLDRDKITKDMNVRKQELGYTIDAILSNIGADSISRPTVIRVLKGDSRVSSSKIRLVMEALQMDPAKYMDTDMLFDSNIDSKGLEEGLDSQRILYPVESLCLDHPIRNLADFLYYLPLVDPLDLANIVNKICLWPDSRNTSYVVSQINWIYEHIPASPAKDYGDVIRRSSMGRYRKLCCSTKTKYSFSKHLKESEKCFLAYQEKVKAFCYMLMRLNMYSRLDSWKMREQRYSACGFAAFGAVRLRKKKKKLYWFNVCTPLCQYLFPNCTVTVETSKGIFNGTLIKFMVGADRQELAHDLGYFPKNDIISVYTMMPMDRIYIQPSFVEHPPDDHKVSRQKHEWLKDGRFKTNVVIRSDGVLLDGYSAYLAAVKLNMTTLYCKVLPEQVKRFSEMREE